ncbi:tetratricopeptide repeat protein [Methanobrevibacter sp.]|uniref:tetratricopeptide repeat protein n=1 Tax=Methanobrevibacter sp. TaxID=66852 RepID=UPI0025F74337|nr:tetratricopeptide repeat protein [Methanobrevibacter sp.]MBQ2665401.1 tetratricopeptide repeat protein [Methanobrevibacter sp.]
MYEEIIKEIKSNLGSNKDLNRQYLSSQIEVYKDHPYSKEIIREISRLMWDCLSEDEKQEFIEISSKENPIMDILNDIYPDIENGNYETPLDKLDDFMQTFPDMFEDDAVSEYHYFTNPLEELVFRKYIGLKKELRYIPDNEPLLDLYYVYGFLLLESQRYDKAEEYLKKAIKINPVSARIILELTEIYKVHTYTLNESFIRTCDALKYAYYPQDIARCYRNLGYYYVEENDMKTALALYIFSMEYEASPLAYAEIKFIQSKNDISLSLKESIDIIKSKNIQLGVNPFILETIDEFIKEYGENKLYNQMLYFMELKFDLTDDAETLEKINEIRKGLQN